MALSKLVKLAMKGATKTKPVPKRRMVENLSEDFKKQIQKELDSEGTENFLKDFLGERTIQGRDASEFYREGLPEISANKLEIPSTSFTIERPTPFHSSVSVDLAFKEGVITKSEADFYKRMQNKNIFSEIEEIKLNNINEKIGNVVAEKEVASDLANMANMTDQEIFLHTKQAEYEARKAGIKNFNKEEFASDLINERNQALKLLEEDMIPMTDFIQRSEPTPMQVPTPANERKKGGSVIERNPYGNYRKLI